MRVVLQRVLEASVTIDGVRTAAIGRGMLVLCGFEEADNQEDLDWMARKIAALRIYDDEDGVMNRSVVDVGEEVLVVSQFTLMASTKKGNRPSYVAAARPEISIPLYERFKETLSAALGRPVACGVFGADMKVALINDGPVTICIDSKNKN
ncbi:MAG: D-tyrosyl-tRNA(Tyr) deacylase [Bacteroidales bacterium]|nr:D-tyrosyl-tRNA(Tyr) deacylase [Bacteroidales bacterium]MBQ1636715.1 D-tyrosyl-tRNA(Tyr) deacylase [Bacteroidales bacterium]MBQ1754037.1 D-tyrosyl-tRNA(Tyr) deacylase [Bacteroidales bacterium]MBQ2193844.1 D-tyrosyl-tRNA(Tyr) deacylase [Bacteroidales bacterium]